MIEVPGYVLKKLQCVQCGGYLSYGPLVINEKNEQLCGRCFRILPDQIKTQYNNQGCTHTFTWNNGTNHESTCPHRYNTLPLEKPNNNNNKEIDLTVSCYNNYKNEDSVLLNIDMVGKNDNKLCLNDENIRLNIELAVSLDTITPKVTYTHINIEKHINEKLYDTISTVSQDVRCTNCHKNLLTTEVFHCGFGHSLCKFCKTNSCNVCGVVPTSEAQHYCKNYRRGCRTLFSDVGKHEIDCEFNDFQCRLCKFNDTLDNLIDHFTHNHGCILSNELTPTLSKKDTEWYFYCFNRLFHCKYYYFDDKIEFIVSYIGSNDNAAKHKYEVSLSTQSTKTTKKAKCLGWNELLDEGVSFELPNTPLKNLQVRITIL